MKNLFVFLLAVVISLCSFEADAQIPKPDHIVVVILENHAFDQIVGSKHAPFMNSIINGKNCALFVNAYAVTHPSQPNYLAIFAGSTLGITDDDLPKVFPFTQKNLGAELLQHGYTFAGYSEDLPATGYNGKYTKVYARKHNPWVNWQDSKENGIPAKLNLPFTAFPENFNKLPTVAFVIPNINDDMHDGREPVRTSRGDKWIQTNLGRYINWAKNHNSLFIVTFDEDNVLEGNHIPTFIYGPMVKAGKYKQKINHYNLLRTIEDIYKLPYAGASADSSAIQGCWLNLNKKK